MQSTNPLFNRLQISNFEATVIDDDKPGLILTESDPGHEVVEGDSQGSLYTVGLHPRASRRRKGHGDPGIRCLATHCLECRSDAGASRFDAATNSIWFDSTNWQNPFLLRVVAVDDSIPENTLAETITHTVSTTAGGLYAGVSDPSELKVTLRDNDTGGVIVTQTGGSTLVSANQSDTYTLQLTKAPTSDVRVDILSDGKTLISSFDPNDTRFHAGTSTVAPYVVFSPADWNIPFAVQVDANPNAQLPVGQPVQEFVAQPHVTNAIAGPLFIEGGVLPNVDRTLRQPVTLPTEDHTPGTIAGAADPNAPQSDVVHIFNDGSAFDDVGQLGGVTNSSGLNTIYGYSASALATHLPEFGNLSGLGMSGPLQSDIGVGGAHDLRSFDGGITYHSVSIVDVMLGFGNDTFIVNSTTAGSITAIQGGGNSLVSDGHGGTVVGGDHITVNGGGGVNSPLIIYGDTSQDGADYDGNLGKSALARPFTYSGNDVIDASADPNSVVIYGGGGNDVIYGGMGDDQLAGGSGNDEIHGGAGNDHIYGDSGFNVDLAARVLTVAVNNASLAPA